LDPGDRAWAMEDAWVHEMKTVYDGDNRLLHPASIRIRSLEGPGLGDSASYRNKFL
jgi:hypothetical protein